MDAISTTRGMESMKEYTAIPNQYVMASPITGGHEVVVERVVSSKFIIDGYRKSYGIDVSHLFRGKDSVEVFRCEESGFRFFGPSYVAGDSDFYAALQEFPWYYMDWKWEHQIVKDGMTTKSKVLEIGCAEGAFIRGLGASLNAVGLELNQTAAANGVAAGMDIRTETIQDHAIENAGTYDVVCSFQVMEHVTDVRGILQASIKALKPGGKLIISVPNNDSFIKHSPDSILNMPPHHMCLWDEGSLAGLENHFDIKLLKMDLEPLQSYHYAVVVNNFVERWVGRGVFGKVIKKALKITQAYKVVSLFKSKVKGHSVVAFYEKQA